jgi:hypothetical protein
MRPASEFRLVELGAFAMAFAIGPHHHSRRGNFRTDCRQSVSRCCGRRRQKK